MGSELNEKLRGRLDRQIGQALAIQALVPLITELLPSDLIELSGIFNWPYQANVYVCLLYIWLPVVNPLATIFMVRPYRRVVAAWIGGWMARRGAGSSESPQPTIPTLSFNSLYGHM